MQDTIHFEGCAKQYVQDWKKH